MTTTTPRFPCPSRGCYGLDRVAPPFPCQKLRGYCFYRTQPLGSRPAACSVHNYKYSSDCQAIKCFLAAGSISALVASSLFWIATRETDNIINCDKNEPSSSFPDSSHHHTPPMFDSVSPRGPLRLLRLHPNLEICYDQRTRNAVYVQERLVVGADEVANHQIETNQPQSPAPRRQKKNYRFKEEPSIPELFRSRNSYYHRSGWDRGHLAAAANYSNQAVQATYNLCNVSPQDSMMNRTLWAWLEDWTRRVAKTAHERDPHRSTTTYVTTGPLWLPNQQVSDNVFALNHHIWGIGRPPTLVLVPTHFFKVVVVVDTRQHCITHFACFVIPNQPPKNNNNDNEDQPSRYIAHYTVPWTDLEAVTGLEFYPGYVTEEWKKQADAITLNYKQTILGSFTRTLGQESGQMMLLTAGEPRAGAGGTASKLSNQLSLFSKKMQRGASFAALQHLCDDVACFPRRRKSK